MNDRNASLALSLRELGVDVDNDAALLQIHNVHQLQGRLQHALRVRAWLRGVVTGAVFALATVALVSLLLWHGQWLRTDTDTPNTLATATTATNPTTATAAKTGIVLPAAVLPAAPTPQPITCPAVLSAPEVIHAPAPRRRSSGSQPKEAPRPLSQTDAPALELGDHDQSSRLRAMVELHSRVQTALHNDDKALAKELLDLAAQRFANGPLAPEFAKLEAELTPNPEQPTTQESHRAIADDVEIPVPNGRTQ